MVAYVGTRGRVARSAAWVAIGGNLVWVLASVLLAASDWVSPTALGFAFVAGQAAAAALLAEVQHVGLRSTRPPLVRSAAR